MDEQRTRERTVATAQKTTESLGLIFSRLSSLSLPYQTARRGVRETLTGKGTRDVSTPLAALRQSTHLITEKLLTQALTLGLSSGYRQASAWSPSSPLLRSSLIPGTRGVSPALLGLSIGASHQAWMAIVEKQILAVQALVATGASVDEILGDEGRQGVLRESETATEGSRWITDLTSAAVIAFLLWLLSKDWSIPVYGTQQPTWDHQVVATIDERTTDCCLRAHGQVVPLTKDFTLTGYPRYADHLPHPPFHWYCRTSEVMLPHHLANDQVTQAMISASRAELAARPSRVEIHPSSATSRRAPGH